MRYVYIGLVGLALIFGLAGCKSSGSSGVSGVIDRGDTPGALPLGNQPALAISGQAPPAAKVGETYSFAPALTSLSARGHTFTVDNLPGWMSFNSSSGKVSGTPRLKDIGVHRDISISVYDGFARSKLPPFSIEVVAEGDLGIELAWYPPEENVDGSPVDLAGYKIQYGRQSGSLTSTIDIDDPYTTSIAIEGLVQGIYYFTMAAYNYAGIDGEFSEEVAVLLY